MSYSLKDEEIESKNRAKRNLAKAKNYERTHKMYTYTTPDKRTTISCETEAGLARMMSALGLKEEEKK